MKTLVWVLVLVLLVLHQDNWNWTSDKLVFGFIPIGLAWHAGISIGASIVWLIATLFCWPEELEYHEPAPKAEGESAS